MNEPVLIPRHSQPLAAIRAFDVEWCANGAFQVRASFEEPVPVTGANESLFERVRDTLAEAVRIGLGGMSREGAEESERNIEICLRQYGGSVEQWSRYHDVYLADAASRALRDAEDQARREYIRREADQQAERNRLIEICKRHYAPHFICAWWLLPLATLQGYGACALLEDCEQAHIEDACRTRGKKIDACVRYYRFRNRQHFEAMTDAQLDGWYSGMSPRWRSA